MTGVAREPVPARAPAAPAMAAPSVLASLEAIGAPLLHARTAPFPGAHVTLPLRSAERMLTLAGPGDVVCLPVAPDPTFVECLLELGLGADPARIVVPRGEATALLWPRLLADAPSLGRIAALLPATGTAWLATMASVPDDLSLAAALAAVRGAPVRVLGGGPDLVARVNHKPVVRAAALALGVPVADGTVVRLPPDADGRHGDLAPLHRAIQAVTASTGRAIVRGAVGASGSSVFVTGPDGLTGATGERFTAVPAQSTYLVEAFHEVLVSPNVQVFIDPHTRTATCVSVTDQLLTPELAHRGNAYPSLAETAPAMVEASLRLAGWLAGQGYAGILGLDFVEYADPDGGRRFVLAEINPRYNGATQPMAMLERLNRQRRAASAPAIGAVAGGVLRTPARSVPALLRSLGSRRYDPVSGAGVVPFHTAGLPDGVCGLTVFAPTRAEAVQAFERLEAEGKGLPHAG
jgi:hypothetical protein